MTGKKHPRLRQWATPAASLLAALLATAAHGADLVSHDGFEACWSQALTKPEFLGLLQSTLDARTGCVATSSGSSGGISYTICNTAACPDAAVGCPVTTHANTFSGDFSSGAFSGSGSADTISVPIDTSIGSCVLTISNVTFAFAPDYTLTADGNNGDYMAALTQAPVTVTNHTFAGNSLCQTLVGLYGSTIITQIENAAGNAVVSLLTPATVGESVCPLTP